MILYFKINDKKYFINNNLELIHKVIYLPLIYVLLISIPISTIYNDLSFESFFSISRCLKIIITFYGSIAIVTLYKEKFSENFFDIMCKHLLYIILINALIMFLQLFIPEFREFTSSYLFNNVSDIHFQTLKRVGGLYLSGGALASVFQGLGLILIPYLSKSNRINLFETILYFIIILFSIVITGRSGLFLLPISIILFLKNSAFGVKITVLSSLSIIIFYVDEFFYFIESIAFDTENELLRWNLYRFLRFSNENSDLADTFNTISNKFSFPDDLKILFFGNLGFSNLKENIMVSDMGWNLVLYKYGLLGIIFYYIPFFTVLFISFKKKNIDKLKSLFIKLLIFSFLLFEFKEQIIYARNGYSILLLIIISYLLTDHKEHFSEKYNQLNITK